MDKVDKQISEELHRICHVGQDGSFPIMSGKVVPSSINETEGTCKVVFPIDDMGVETESVINAVLQNSNGLILYPDDDSTVLCCLEGGSWIIIKCSDLTKVKVTIGSTTLVMDSAGVVFNGGNLGGMVKVQELTDKVNRLENSLNTLSQKWNTFCGVYIPGSPTITGLPATLSTSTVTEVSPLTQRSDIENTNVKQ